MISDGAEGGRGSILHLDGVNLLGYWSLLGSSSLQRLALTLAQFGVLQFREVISGGSRMNDAVIKTTRSTIGHAFGVISGRITTTPKTAAGVVGGKTARNATRGTTIIQIIIFVVWTITLSALGSKNSPIRCSQVPRNRVSNKEIKDYTSDEPSIDTTDIHSSDISSDAIDICRASITTNGITIRHVVIGLEKMSAMHLVRTM